MLSIISPTRDTSNKKIRSICKKFVRRETDKRKKITESNQASLLINEEKHIGEVKCKALLRKIKRFFSLKKGNQNSIKNYGISSP